MSKNKYNLIFMGTPDFSVPTLQKLISDERFSISAVITAPDSKIGRKQIVTPPPVKVEAEKHNIPVLQPKKLSANKNVGTGQCPVPTEEIKKLQPDAIIIIAYGQLIPKKILDIPKYGCLNLHASLLPKYRGASPIQSAIANGDQETGITLMKIDEGMDTGAIIAQEKKQIVSDETGNSLHDKLAELSAEVAQKYLAEYLAGKLKPVPQNYKGRRHSACPVFITGGMSPSYASKLTRESGCIDWNKSAEEIERQVRAYYPWPGTHASWRGKTLKIIKTNIISENKHSAGKVFLFENQLAVQCEQDALLIKQLQLEGKKIMTSKEFLGGHQDIVGVVLK
ncbi:MAG: methionyl-tRNA formyltransferase [Candidatus Falkowbacteria bacterium]